MRKISKVLTVLLTFILLVGVMLSVVASAESESRETLNITKSSKNLYTDFESKQSNGNHYIRFFVGEYSSSTSNAFQVEYPTVSGNTYARYSSKGNNTLASATVAAVALIMPDYKNASYLVGNDTGSNNMGAYDYAVLDFEMASDKYTFTFTADVTTTYTQGNGAPTVTNETDVTVHKTVYTEQEYLDYKNGKPIPESVVEWTVGTVNHKKVYTYTNVSVNDDLRLAYDEEAYIYPEARTFKFSTNSEGDKTQNNGPYCLRTRYDASLKKWYADTAGGTRVYLSDKAGVFNHVTYVFETKRIEKENASSGYYINKSMVHVFVNGTYVSSNPLLTTETAIDTYTIYRLRTNISKSAQNNDRFSLCFDNVALNLYGYRVMDNNTKQYATVDRLYKSEGYGIDDYIQNEDYKDNKPLYICDEILYGSNYSFVAAPVVAEIERDGNKTRYAHFYSAIRNIKAHDFVHMYEDFKDFTPTSYDIDNVTFISHDDAILELSKEAKEFYKIQHTDDRYTIRIATGGIIINWYDGVGENPIKSQSLIPFVAPTHDSEALKIFGKVEYIENRANIQIFNHWLWDKEGNDGVGDTELDEIFKEHTVEDLNKLLEKGIVEINIYPDYELHPLKYSIETMDSLGGVKPDFVVQDYKYESFTDFANLQSALSAIDKEIKVTLYDDYCGDTIEIPAGVTINFDLNGHKITSEANVFKVLEGSTLNLYSTKENAVIEAYSIVASDGIDACTINIGAMSGVENAKGSNVNLTANKILNFVGSNTDETNSKKIVVNLNGGTYTSKTGSSETLFPISDMDMIISVSDGAVISASSETEVFSIDSQYNVSAEISVIGSKIIADSTIGDWSNSCKMYIEKSIITGIDIMNANITLGEYNFIKSTDADFDPNSIRTSAGVSYALASAGKLLVPLSESLNIECNVLTFIPSMKNSADIPDLFKNVEIDTIGWYNQNGQLHKTTYWVKGSEINTGYVSAEGFGIKNDSGNGWFAYAYNTWEKVTTSQGDLPEGIDVVYKPVAEKIVKSFDEVYVSLGISNEFMYNIYVPVPSDDLGAEIEFQGFFDKNGTLISSGESTEPGYRFTGFIEADVFTADTVIIKYTVNGEPFEHLVTVDIFEYAYKVDEAYGCGTEESKLVYAMLQYKLAVVGDFASAEIIVDVEDYLNSHGVDCKCSEVAYSAPEENVDYSSIENLVTGFAYTLELDGTGDKYHSSYSFSIYFKKDSGVLSVNGDEFKKYENDDYIEYRLNIVNPSDITKVIELTVTTDAGNLTATYSLAKYIAESETDNVFAKALYVISKSATTEQ